MRYIKPDAGNKQVLLVSRLMVVALGLWALWQSLGTSSVLAKWLYAYTIYSAALTPVILAAFFWRRATAPAAVASIAAGTVVTVGWDTISPHLPQVIGDQDAILPALLASLFVPVRRQPADTSAKRRKAGAVCSLRAYGESRNVGALFSFERNS